MKHIVCYLNVSSFFEENLKGSFDKLDLSLFKKDQRGWMISLPINVGEGIKIEFMSSFLEKNKDKLRLLGVKNFKIWISYLESERKLNLTSTELKALSRCDVEVNISYIENEII